MAKLVDVLQRDSCFQPGSTLCAGCMESIAFQNIGKLTDNGRKTIFALGTFCGEVSTLQYPNPVAWGRGEETPDDWTKSFGIMHHVFESAPSVAEGIADTAQQLFEIGALSQQVQVCSLSGDGGALSIGLRTLLHTIARGTSLTIFVLINEIFANTGFQYSPTTSLGSETSTTPVSELLPGNMTPPIDYLGLAVTAGAQRVVQASPAHPKFFNRMVEQGLSGSGTTIIFVPSPCITGWKYPDGETVHLAQLACETGFFPCYAKERGRPGELKFVELDATKRPPIEAFLGLQRRFQHLVRFNKATGTYDIRPGQEESVARIRDWIQHRLEQLQRLA
ncbi:MAG: hypothetical protein HYV02_05150 [Deltaproteobacteria bacterium]|nr:hypothetical protein [Deltaproteobacteria bacterium]